jgi:hypothetical protein
MSSDEIFYEMKNDLNTIVDLLTKISCSNPNGAINYEALQGEIKAKEELAKAQEDIKKYERFMNWLVQEGKYPDAYYEGWIHVSLEKINKKLYEIFGRTI